jgi:hypothetical protein
MHFRFRPDDALEDLAALYELFDGLCDMLHIGEREYARRVQLARLIMRMAVSGKDGTDEIRRQMMA